MEATDTQQVIDCMIRTDRRHRALCDRETAAIGLHRSQGRMLGYLFRRGGAASQKEIAEEMNITPAVVTVSLKKLVQDGYAERTTAKEDKRSFRVTLTEKGERVIMQAHAILQRIDTRMLRGFSKAELVTLTDFYRRMLDNMEQAEKEEGI